MISGGNGHGSIGFAGASKISDVFRNGNEPGNNANTLLLDVLVVELKWLMLILLMVL